MKHNPSRLSPNKDEVDGAPNEEQLTNVKAEPEVSADILLEANAYKVSTLGSALTYLIVLYRANFEDKVVEFNEHKNEVIVKSKLMTMSEFVKNENAQLLGYVLLWNFTPRSLIKLVPFLIYSMLNLTSFLTSEVIPDYPFSLALIPLLNYLEVPLLIIASHFDIFSFFILFKECIDIQNAYPFIIFLLIWLLRYESSEACRSSFVKIWSFITSIFIVGRSGNQVTDDGKHLAEDFNGSSATLTAEN
ncbi:hypothetical protein WICMUC_002047 [Wickerhamomyces mucosus]|uniref:Uncharacterized protein n=1 Tax=Wickerhamomyces mucosus TaxID=1378264 RepID=A0A9P8TFF9_9ASCO|nr:hypothetical protein WICMUC_002047 [Wickerhamomyces mucosus]